MEIKIAKYAGFCSGVEKAVKLVEESVEDGSQVYTFGELIHNKDEVARLSEKGVKVINDIEDVNSIKNSKIVVRSHGIPKNEFLYLEQFEEKNCLEVVDGTCPFVKNIHKIVEEKYKEGYEIVIIGDKNHTEVRGIMGYCGNNGIICANNEELEKFFEKKSTKIKKKVAIVAQTTYNIKVWEKCKNVADAQNVEVELYRTICNATTLRQKAAEKLALESDIMIIVGGKHSSNTKKLYEICKKHCPVSVHIENGQELLNLNIIEKFDYDHENNLSVGITAGASTPAYIIKEVQKNMSEILKNQDEDFNFEEALNASFKKIYTGNRVKGYITAVNNSEAVVDVGTKHTGYISLSELTDDPSLKPSDVVSVGDEVEVIVIKINDAEGIAQLSKKRVDSLLGFDKLKAASDEGTVLEGVVTSIVKGGIIVLTEGTKVFIPASQATMRRDDKLEALKGKTVNYKLIEVSEQKMKAVGSIKAVLGAKKEEDKQKFWEAAQIGDKYKGEVKSITNFGVFVDLGGIDGMVHISELSWSRIKHPSEVCKIGDVIEVFVKDLDKESNRISLGYRKTEESPWFKFTEEYKEGDVVDCKIVSLTPFGAFAAITDTMDGLIHISQVSDKKINNVAEVLTVGDTVKVKITEIDNEKQRISLSIKALIEDGDAE